MLSGGDKEYLEWRGLTWVNVQRRHIIIKLLLFPIIVTVNNICNNSLCMCHCLVYITVIEDATSISDITFCACCCCVMKRKALTYVASMSAK